MIGWEINVVYGGRSYVLLADLEYHAARSMRIRVWGKYGSMLLENNYPALRATNSQRGITWELKEGSFVSESRHNAPFLRAVMEALEKEIRTKFPPDTIKIATDFTD